LPWMEIPAAHRRETRATPPIILQLIGNTVLSGMRMWLRTYRRTRNACSWSPLTKPVVEGTLDCGAELIELALLLTDLRLLCERTHRFWE
jgi:hypothetical protein